MEPRTRRLWQTGALALVSCLLSLAAVELGLRLFWRDYYVKFRPGVSVGETHFHPQRGWALVPGIRVVQGDTEFTVTLTHNRAGFRGPELAAQKSPARPRVLVLGDSMTYGRGVEDDETFAAVLARLEPGLEVINAGTQGYSGVEQLLLLRDEGLRLEPDVVVLGFFWNDVIDAYKSAYARFELDGDALREVLPSPASPEHPAFARERRRQTRRTGLWYTLSSHSYTWRFFSDRLKLLHLLLDEWWGEAEARHGADPAELEPAWQLSFALIREMRRLTEQAGAHFLLFPIPDQIQIETDVRLVGGDAHHLHGVQARLAEFAAAEGVAFFDPLPVLRRERARDGAPYHHRFDRHWNALGHRRAGEALDAELRARGWLAAR